MPAGAGFPAVVMGLFCMAVLMGMSAGAQLYRVSR